MQGKIDDGAENSLALTPSNRRFSLFDVFLLTAAFALWLFLLPEYQREPVVVAVFWTIAIAAGICGHLVYTYLLPWRGTVVIGLTGMSIAVFAAVLSYFESGSNVTAILPLPIELLRYQTWSNRIRFTVPVLACIAIFTAAHPVKPGLINAIITAMGISLWYGLAILIADQAG